VSSLSKPRIAWFAPLSSESPEAAGSVSAYVTDQLLPQIRSDFEIDLFGSAPGESEHGNVFHFTDALEQHLSAPYDFFFYHIEDTPACDFVRLHLTFVPGMVMFHDVLFRDMRRSEDVIEAQQKAEVLWSEAQTSTLAHALVEPFVSLEARASLAAVFTSARNLGEYRRHTSSRVQLQEAGKRPAYYLPCPVSPGLVQENDRVRSSGRPCVAYCGCAALEHRAHYLLSALSELDFEVHLLWLVGEHEYYEAQSLCREFEIADAEIRIGKTPESWKAVAETADAAVHTLFSAYGDPEPYLSLSLMAGLPSIVSDFSSTGALPEGVVYKISCGDKEIEEFKAAFCSCLHGARADEEWGARSRAARSYAREMHSTPLVAAEMTQIIHSNAAELKEQTGRWFGAHGPNLPNLLGECVAAWGWEPKLAIRSEA